MAIIHIAGHLGADAESRVTPSGQKVLTLRIASNIRKGGKDETVWFRVTVWGDRYDKMVPYLKKGAAVMVVGRLDKPEIYTDKEGRPQVSLNVTAEIVEFSPFGKSDKAGGSSGQPASNPYSQGGSGGQEPASYGAGPYGGYSSGQQQSTHGQGSSFQHAENDADALPF